MPLAEDVTEEVRRRMRARGMSANALARAAGMPPRLLHRVMAGERALTLDEVEAVAPALGCGPAWLLQSALKNPPDQQDDQADATLDR